MKKLWSWKTAACSLFFLLVLTLIPACFESTQSLAANGTSLLLGLPFAFYTILIKPAGGFAIHLNIAGLAADALILYSFLFLIQWLLGSIKSK